MIQVMPDPADWRGPDLMESDWRHRRADVAAWAADGGCLIDLAA